ncbi:hypothetical protein GCM10010168_68840 [Actinoplanes ianthinogenes]|uniref:Uncharacterized protein n=1 Tax=Actinoplanes ianthinogenes TaxID=122358 RepID=A0ABN6CJJ3_9ACTN|nr:hypothetical protein Aiant_57410 [Actinoplanes ianthinogenes]GGR40469.1 hypothetical protein GCM10010168_68840 [Actinoplanes ianthinogenes]
MTDEPEVSIVAPAAEDEVESDVLAPQAVRVAKAATVATMAAERRPRILNMKPPSLDFEAQYALV